MAVVGRHDQQRFVPVAVPFDPVGDCLDRRIAAVDGTDRVVDVVVVVGPVDIARFHHQPEPLGVFLQYGEGRRGHVGQPGVLVEIGRSVRFGESVVADRGAIVAVRGLKGQMAFEMAVKAEQALARSCRLAGLFGEPVLAVDARRANGEHVFSSSGCVDRLQVGVGDPDVAGDKVLSLAPFDVD